MLEEKISLEAQNIEDSESMICLEDCSVQEGY